jgi:TonB family protein
MGKTRDRGKVVVGFTVSSNGNIINAHVANTSDSKMLDASAVKIIQSLDHWRPGVQRGKKVPVDLTVPVNFN